MSDPVVVRVTMGGPSVVTVQMGGPARVKVTQLGIRGAQGDQGDPGVGLAPGGTTGQFAVKASNADYDTTWVSGTTDLNQALFLSAPGPMEGYTTPYQTITYTGLDPTSVVWFTDNTETTKVSELTVSYTNHFATGAIFVVYQPDGTTPKTTVTDVFNYTGVLVTSTERTVS